jgi:hypothetical protein
MKSAGEQENCMQEKTRGKLIVIIGILAFIIAGVSFVFSVLDLLSMLQAADWQFLKALRSSQAYDMAVDLVFAGLELTMGLMLIKQWREGERVEVYKTLSKLINAVVYASFVKVIFGMVMAYAVDKSLSELNVSIVYCIIYLVYYVLTASSGTLLRKRQWMSLYITMLIASALGVGFCVYDCITVVKAAAAVEIGTTFANTLLMGLIVVFSVGVVAYYAKDPATLWRDVLDGEDFDVVDSKGDYERVKIYATRAQEGAMNVVILVLYCLCALLGIAGIVLYAVENDIGQYFGGTIQSFIDNISNQFESGSVDEILNLLVLLLLVMLYPLIYLSQVLGAIQRKAESKISVISISGMGNMLVMMASLSLLIGVMYDFTMFGTIRWEEYSIYQAVLIVLYLVYFFTKRIYKNTTKEVNDGIMQGDSYNSHSGSIARICLFSSIFSAVGLVVIFLMKCSDSGVCVSYLLFAAAALLAAAGACLEVKYPFSEFEYAKRKIVDTVEETAENSETATETA